MVLITQCLKNELKRFKRMRGSFLDKIFVHVKAGTGGMGNPKFGGIGGKGGDVYLLGTEAHDLRSVQTQFPEKRIYAGHGSSSQAKQLLGRRGIDVVVNVPCGVKAISDFRKVLGEINQVGEKVIIAKGGVGGCAATNFSGMRGEKYNVVLELSIISDISILGFPNAGKSTFLRACSNAKPKVADYPFTTIKPNVGIMQFTDGRKISIADLPGLIEGAHQNYGRGHQFLRHVERCRCVMMIVDVFGFQLDRNRPFRTAFETVMLLNKELELYNTEFLKKPISLVVNKMDLPGSEKKFDELRNKLKNVHECILELPESLRPENIIEYQEILPISAKTGDDVGRIKNHFRDVIDGLVQVNEAEVDEKLAQLKLQHKEFGPSLV